MEKVTVMAFSNSPLVSLTKLSPNKSKRTSDKIDMIVVHCYAARVSIETALNNFAKSSSGHSSQYILGEDGRIGQSVLEEDRSWTTGGKDKNGKVIYNHGYSGAMIDHRAVTIECSSGAQYPYEINEKVYDSLVKLLADICRRNNIKQLLWKNDQSLIGQVDKQNLALHRWFANKECPGFDIISKLDMIVAETNTLLSATSPQQPTAPMPVTKPYKYVNSDGYIINLFDLKNDWNAWFAAASAYRDSPKKAYTANSFAYMQNADLVTNLALFKMKNNETINYVRTTALQEVGYGGTEKFGIILELNWANKCAGYAVAIKNGVVQPNNRVSNPYLGGASCRNGIGFTEDGRLIIAQSTNKVSEKVFANKINSVIPAMYGVKVRLFLFEDGGGSTQQYSAISKLNFTPMGVRAVPTVTCLKRKSFPKVTRTLQKGDFGWDVVTLQTILGGISCDGSYGGGTANRVKAFQKANKLPVTGVADQKTLQALGLM